MNSSKKISTSPKTTGRFATPEEAAQAKNAGLINHIKKLGLKVERLTSTPE